MTKDKSLEEKRAEAKQLFADGTPVEKIAKRFNRSLWTINHWIRPGYEERCAKQAMRMADYYAIPENKERIRKQQKVNYDENKEERQEKNRKYYDEHRDELVVKRRDRYALTRR